MQNNFAKNDAQIIIAGILDADAFKLHNIIITKCELEAAFLTSQSIT